MRKVTHQCRTRGWSCARMATCAYCSTRLCTLACQCRCAPHGCARQAVVSFCCSNAGALSGNAACSADGGIWTPAMSCVPSKQGKTCIPPTCSYTLCLMPAVHDRKRGCDIWCGQRGGRGELWRAGMVPRTDSVRSSTLVDKPCWSGRSQMIWLQ